MHKVIKREYTLCPCCMEEHDVLTVEVDECDHYKGIDINYKATYYYCDKDDVYYISSGMIDEVWDAMREAYDKVINK